MSGERPSTPAEAAIREAIERRGPLTFAEYMELALYAPGTGYYARDGATTGARGDFATSPDVSPAFGRCLARQAAEVHARLGGGAWSVVELGPGRGLLTRDLLEALREQAPDAWESLERVVLVERSASLRERLEARIAPSVPAGCLATVASLAAVPDASVRGFVVANELLDALPVHVVERRRDALCELRVAIDRGGALALVPGPVSDARIERVARAHGLCPRPGWRAEVCLALEDLLAELARVLERGAALFIDYGHDAERIADAAHAEGTLVGYRDHRVVIDPLAAPGEQDLTAHVNWSHFEACARGLGLEPAGRVPQERLLLALGLLDEFRVAGDGDFAPAAVARRLAAKRLIAPGAGGGSRFEATLLVRGLGHDLRAVGPVPAPG